MTLRDRNGFRVVDESAYRWAYSNRIAEGQRAAIEAPAHKHATSWAGSTFLALAKQHEGAEFRAHAEAVMADEQHALSGAAINEAWPKDVWLRTFSRTFTVLVERHITEQKPCRVCGAWRLPGELSATVLCNDGCEQEHGAMVRDLDAARFDAPTAEVRR